MRVFWAISTLLISLTGVILSYSYYTDDIPYGTCAYCHTNDYFSVDFANNGHLWNATLAHMDSDSDGFTNGVELQDANGEWQVGDQDPGDPTKVTNPDDPNDFPDAISSTSLGYLKWLMP